MPRIRSIKPEFWTDGAIIALPYEARLFYIGMWNFACDRGHLSDDPLGLKLKILPADIVDGAVLLDALVSAGRVERVALPDGRGFLSIPRFNDHQRIDTRWNSRCGLCSHLDSPNLTETHASLHKLTPGGEGRGEERKGGRADAPAPAPYCPNHPGGTDRPCGPCRTARLAFESAQVEVKRRASTVPEVRRERTCTVHAEYPLPCHRCEEGT
jgi:hypothetical protein